jgi:hypothetical protein
MTWWMILILALLGIGLLGGGFSAVRRVRQTFSAVPELLRSLSTLSSSGQEPESPRSLSSLESVLLPRVLQDFPEYNQIIIA